MKILESYSHPPILAIRIEEGDTQEAVLSAHKFRPKSPLLFLQFKNGFEYGLMACDSSEEAGVPALSLEDFLASPPEEIHKSIVDLYASRQEPISFVFPLELPEPIYLATPLGPYAIIYAFIGHRDAEESNALINEIKQKSQTQDSSLLD